VKLESIQCEAVDEAAMLALGAALSAALGRGSVVYLVGDLGMGKTTLARGILRALGHEGTVKSPTYTLVEPYEVGAGSVFHFDLYRLGDPLVEWPQRGAGFLPPADLVVTIGPAGNGRHLDLVAHSSLGAQCLERLSGDSAIKMRQECNE
jgi:tRNA threonylcarbamoyladenosine biosynthesis protein TsaE